MLFAATALASIVPIALGLLVVLRSTQRVIGWLLVAHGVSVGLLLGGSQATATGRAALAVDQLLAGSWIFFFLWLVLIAYLLPDGRALSRFWSAWVLVGLGGATAFLVGAVGDGGGFRSQHDGHAPPLPWLPPQVSGLLGVIGLVLVVLLFFGSVVAVGARLRRVEGAARTRLLWLVWGALAVPAGLLLLWANYFVLHAGEWLATAVLTMVSLALPATIAIAVLRHRLFDIRPVLSRTLIYGALTVGVVAVYALPLLAAESVGGSGTAGGLLAVVVVAVTAHPAYSWLRRRVERWVYGYRAEPERALRLLADRAEAADAEGLVASITAAVAESLRTDGAWVDDGRGRREYGVHRVSLEHRGERLGDLVVGVPPGRRFDAAELALLRDLARYAAVLVRAERQAEELRESRSRIVAGREEERRRLRRDLHDGVGPSLAAAVLTIDSARSRADDTERAALLAEAATEVRGAIAEVRRVVDDLRPPAIDEIGLLGAIRQRAAALAEGVRIEVTGPESMPALPAAVEVAAFRIASEAMTNVVRHAHATRCRVVLGLNGAFELTVSDNGRGTPASGGTAVADGVGWLSMRERAAEVGGTCTMTGAPSGGLVVHVLLPVDVGS